ncbi:hypothetical protein PFISCL1PPCAC_22617, partial [Pristionchus fissidentatus]
QEGRPLRDSSVDQLAAELSECKTLLTQLIDLVKNPPPSAVPPSTLNAGADVARQMYESCARAMTDKVEYEDKETRAVIIGLPELKDPTAGEESDQKIVEALVAYSGSEIAMKALKEGKITFKRHPENAERNRRPLKVDAHESIIRNSLLKGIRSKTGRPPPLASASPTTVAFIRMDLTPHQLKLEREAGIEVMKRNLAAGRLIYGVRDYSIITYRNPRPLPPNYGNRTRPTENKSADEITSVEPTSPAISAASPPITVPDGHPNITVRSSNHSLDLPPSLPIASSLRNLNSARNQSISRVSCFYANCRSIRCKLPQLYFVLSSLDYHIVSLTETWLDSSDSDAYLISGHSDYLPFRKDRAITDDVGGGGVALLVHQSLSPVFLSSFTSTLLESVVIDIHLTYSNDLPYRKIRLFTVYRSPSSPSGAFVEFLSFITPLLSHEFPCIFTGDFNYPEIDWSTLSSPVHSDLLDFASDHNLSQFVSFPTRHQNILDLVFCNKDIIHNISPSIPLSDHLSMSPLDYTDSPTGNPLTTLFSIIIGPLLFPILMLISHTITS